MPRCFWAILLVGCTGGTPRPSGEGGAGDGGADATTDATDGATDAPDGVAGDGSAELDGPWTVPPQPAPGCPSFDLGTALGSPAAYGNSATGRDTFMASCDFGGSSPELTYAVTPETTGRYAVWVDADFRATVAVLDSCDLERARELACAASSAEETPIATFDGVAGASYVVVVDGGGGGGSFRLHLERAEDCGNGRDDDGDGLTDCAERECLYAPECVEAHCDDGIDNDGDERPDCVDPDCWDACFEAACSDGIDDDADGVTDCFDADCVGSADCETDCGDGIDNNGDGLTDCLAPSCATFTHCIELHCADGLDNDGDGRTDCADSDCQAGWISDCGELDCADGVDNDGSGQADCGDRSCALADNCCDPACPLADLGTRTGVDVAVGDGLGLCDSVPRETCGDDATGGGADAVFRFTAPETGEYEFDTAGSDDYLTLAIHEGSDCAAVVPGTALGCRRDDLHFLRPNTHLRLRLEQDQTVMIVLDRADVFQVGQYRLSILRR